MATILTPGSIEDYRIWLQRRGSAANTIRAYVADVRCFFSETNLEQVSQTDLENTVLDWLNLGRRVWAPKTAARKLTSLKSYCAWVGIQKPLDDYSTPKAARQEPHPLPGGFADIERMIANCNEEDQIILIALCGLVGLRISEALAVETDHVSFQDRVLTVRGKGDVTRRVPLSDLAWLYLKDKLTRVWLSGGGRLLTYCDRSARKIISTLGKRAEVARSVASHDLRATFATESYSHSKDIHTVARLLGHASVETTMLYIGTTMDTMRAAANFGRVSEE